MGVSFFSKVLKREPEEGTNYLSLTLTSDQILATIWRLGENSELIFVGHSEKEFHSIDSLIHEAAVAIDSAAKDITTDVSQVVFGLSNYWFENGTITKETGDILKNLAEELELDAQAFVPLSASITHFYKLKGIEKDALIIGSFKDYTEASWVSEGNAETKEFKGKAGKEDIKNLIEKFPKALNSSPGLIILFGDNAPHLKPQLSKEHKFFGEGSHVDLITNEELSKCISYSQAADVLGKEPQLSTAPVSAPQHHISEANEPQKETEVHDEKENQEVPKAKDENEFEFKEGEDVLKSSPPVESNLTVPVNENKEEYAVQIDQQHGYESPKEKLHESASHKKKSIIDSITTLNWLSHLSKGNKQKLVLPAVILMLLAVGCVYLLGYTLTSAEVLIKSNSQPFEDDFEVTVASGAALDTARSRIPGEETTAVVSDTAQAQATGTKKTGNNAKGEVTVLNWTTSKVNFEKGSVIISRNGVRFNLDNSVEVASRSASSPGEAKTAVTAETFGANGNVSAGSEFTFQKHDELLYSAKNDNAFSGGDEKDITVVTKADQDDLAQSIEENLMQKAREELQQKVGGQNIPDESIELKILQKQFSADIDEEATTLNLNMQVEASALTYKEETLKELLSQFAQEESNGSLESKPENLDIIEVNLERGRGTLSLEGRYRANLVPKIDENNLKNQIAGKSQKSAKEIIKQNPEISDVIFKFSPNLIIFSSVPKNQDKISLKIEAIK